MPAVPKAAIRAAEEVTIPDPWKAIKPIKIKDLAAVGFGPDNEFFMIISKSGCGAFACATGEKLEWVDGPVDYDQSKYTVPGIGPLEGKPVIVSGRGGGIISARILPYGSADKWAAAQTKLPESDDLGVFLRSPPGYQGEVWSMVAREKQMRAIGFSPAGTSFVVALPHELRMLVRS